MHSLHHSFDIELASQYGVQEAIIIHHFQHWINTNMRLRRNYIEGRWWMYQTLEEMAAHFPYLSRDQVNRLIRKLVKKGVLKKGNHNKFKFDRTMWYAFENQEKFLGKVEMDVAKSPDDDVAKSPQGNGQIATPIPDTKTDTKTKKKTRASSDLLQKVQVKDNVSLTQKQIDLLLHKYGKEAYEKMVDKLSSHKRQKGTVYASDYKSFEIWLHNWYENQISRAAAADKSLQEAHKWVKNRVSHLETIGARGNLKIIDSRVFDDVLKKEISIFTTDWQSKVLQWHRGSW